MVSFCVLGEKLKPSLGVSCAGCETKVKAVARWREAERGPGKEEIEKGQTQATTSGTYHAELGARQKWRTARATARAIITERVVARGRDDLGASGRQGRHGEREGGREERRNATACLPSLCLPASWSSRLPSQRSE